ncbi:MAG: hypothetical protein ACRD9W_08525 [Terriglobia bacterium]
MLGVMNRAQQIRHRLAEIEAELRGAPRRVPRKFESAADIGADLDNFEAVEEWRDRQLKLAEERRQLQHEYDLLPKSAKGEI